MLPTATRQFKTVPLPEIIMSQNPTESKYLLSHVIARWACALKYEDLSPAAIEAAKLFWFDSVGCALGGSQQDDARILLKHYRAMGGDGNATAFVSGFKTNPVDAAFLNGHMIRAMDYNDIYWKADPCHPSDLIAAPLALCESKGLSGKDLILATIIACKEGLFAVFKHVQYKGQPAAFDGKAFVADLPNSPKSHYRILDCGMKSFPIEALSHAPLTAMMKTVKENKIQANDVKEIKVEVIARAADILGDPHKYRPDSKETADHSLPYCMAAGLVDGMVTRLQFGEDRVLDKSLIPIMDKVKVVPNEEFEALFPKFQPSRVTITTNSGQSHSTRVDVPKGDPRDPMTEEEIAVKFTALGGNVIGQDQCKKLQKFIMSIENAKNLDGLFELTTARD